MTPSLRPRPQPTPPAQVAEQRYILGPRKVRLAIVLLDESGPAGALHKAVVLDPRTGLRHLRRLRLRSIKTALVTTYPCGSTLVRYPQEPGSPQTFQPNSPSCSATLPGSRPGRHASCAACRNAFSVASK